eukprot:scaffold492873_cov14-Prasinocladus_malaysianus.AAC.1
MQLAPTIAFFAWQYNVCMCKVARHEKPAISSHRHYLQLLFVPCITATCIQLSVDGHGALAPAGLDTTGHFVGYKI